MSPNDDALSRLRQLVIQQKSAHMPDMAPGSVLIELHHRIAAYDEATTLRVRTALQNQPSDRLTELSAIIDLELKNIHQNVELTPEELRNLQRYQRYKQRLDQLNSLADEISR